VVTHHNDNQRTGANLQEATLTAANVNSTQFGLSFTRPVDSFIYSQPLYVPNVAVPGQGTHNVVFVATMNNSVYAFDADDPAQSAPLWQTSLGQPVTIASTPFSSFVQEIGAPTIGELSTPVIDLTSNTLYCCCSTQDTTAGPYHTMLYALDITTGQSKPGSPVEITGAVSPISNRSAGAQNGVLPYDPSNHMNRPALLLDHGVLYVSCGSHGDLGTWHGWVFAYDPVSLTQKGIWCTTQFFAQGSIWQAGSGPAADASGNIYLMDANGSADAYNYSNAFIKLTLGPLGLKLADWFMPYNEVILSSYDMDLGSSGPLVLPGTNYLVGGGKECRIYLIDSTNMGKAKFDSHGQVAGTADPQILQSFFATPNGWTPGGNGPTHHIHGSPVTFTGPAGQQLIYVWPENEYLKSFQFQNGQFITTPYATGPFPDATGMPGGMLSISANGAQNGILWVNRPLSDANMSVAQGCLEAFDAVTLQLLYDSQQNAARDNPGLFGKFTPPTVVNGKVYLATFSNQLDVYALLPPAPPVLTATPISGSEIDLSWTGSNFTGTYIERSTDGVNFTQIAEVDAPATTYADTSVTATSALYYYRVRCFNNIGLSAYSNVAHTSDDPGTPSAPETLTAQGVSQTEIDLAWMNGDSNEDGVIILRSTDGVSFTQIATTVEDVSSYQDTTCAPGTTYYYMVQAYNFSGTSAYSNTASATTIPVAPVIAATVISNTEIDLSWSAVQGATGYNVLRSTFPYTTFTQVGQASSPATTYQDLGLKQGATYEYEMVATNSAGASPVSNIVKASTQSQPSKPPTNLAATAVSSTEIDLTWTIADPGATDTILAISTDQQKWSTLTQVPVPGASYAATKLTPGTTYYFHATSHNKYGASNPSSNVSATTLLATPTLNASAASASEIDLSWTAPGATTVTVQRSTDNQNFTQIAQVTTPQSTYADTSCSPSSTYYYRVQSSSATSTSPYSSVATATTPQSPPMAPTGLTASASSQTEIDLSWSDSDPSVAGYTVQRSTDGVNFTQIGQAGAGQTTYADTTCVPGTGYFYRVAAYNSGGSSAYSNIASAATPLYPPQAPSLSATAVSIHEIDLSISAQFATTIQIQRSTDGVNFRTLLALPGSATGYKDANCVSNTTYYYRAQAANKAGKSAYSTVAQAATPPAAPGAPMNLRLKVISANEIDLSWKAATGVVTGYTIQRSTDSSSFSTIATVSGTTKTYQDTSCAPNTHYYYQVQAYNSGGVSSYSNVPSALTPSLPPAAPALSATAVSRKEIDLSWTVSNAAQILIERSSDNVKFSQIATVSASASGYQDTARTPGKTYYYRARAVNSGGKSGYSNVAQATTPQ
jgi:titin